MKKVTVALVGAGSRGRIYADYIHSHPEQGQVVCVCEPSESRRNEVGDLHNVPSHLRFADWRELANRPKLAEAALVCTQDAMHRDPAVALAGLGYHLLLEKPLAPTAKECRDICRAAIENNIMLAVCHVLRYTPTNRKLKSLVDSGVIGNVQSVQLLEPVGYWHQAHSFVRGNWRNQAESSFMLLAKSCHDLDLLNYLIPGRCKHVSSFGRLSYFKPENKPEGAADRCTDCPECVEKSCEYSAIKIYARDRGDKLDDWPANVVTNFDSSKNMLEELKQSPYGRCAFACDNDVVDHQVVNFEFDSGTTAVFTMTAFTATGTREIYIMGDKGTIRSTEAGSFLSRFLDDSSEVISLDQGDGLITSGHGGGDEGIMSSFLDAISQNDPSLILSGPEISLDSHLMVFAAEKSRLTKSVVALDDVISEL